MPYYLPREETSGRKHDHMHGAALTVLLEGELAEKKTAPPNRPSDAFPQ
jgi:hypothetical protein